ncbi:UNVERIFIED_CONTAM: hypothetical protein K2H54_060763 [Gekko kuhli]
MSEASPAWPPCHLSPKGSLSLSQGGKGVQDPPTSFNHSPPAHPGTGRGPLTRLLPGTFKSSATLTYASWTSLLLMRRAVLIWGWELFYLFLHLASAPLIST